MLNMYYTSLFFLYKITVLLFHYTLIWYLNTLIIKFSNRMAIGFQIVN